MVRCRYLRNGKEHGGECESEEEEEVQYFIQGLEMCVAADGHAVTTEHVIPKPTPRYVKLTETQALKNISLLVIHRLTRALYD